jgi:hypothetical protein
MRSRPDPAGLVAEQRQRDCDGGVDVECPGVVAAGDSESRASLQMLEKEFSTDTLPAGTQPLDTLGKSHQGNRQSVIPVVTAELLHSTVFRRAMAWRR